MSDPSTDHPPGHDPGAGRQLPTADDLDAMEADLDAVDAELARLDLDAP